MTATADAVVVVGGTVGGWCAYFLRQAGLDEVVLLEKRTLGQGASSRAAGVVRTQGGTPWAVQLGEWSSRFRRGSQPAGHRPGRAAVPEHAPRPPGRVAVT